MGYASAPATRNALASHGIRVDGWRWRWALGLKGGTFPPHREINGEYASTQDSFEALPGEDVNGGSCMCNVVPIYRTRDGRFAKPGLEPVFQTPFVASLNPAPVVHTEPMDWSPLVAALSEQPPVYVNVVVPDGAINVQVTVPDFPAFPKIPAPVVNVAAPDVTVNVPDFPALPAPVINVEAPNISVEPNITVQPAETTVIEHEPQKVRFTRNSSGQIETAEVTQ